MFAMRRTVRNKYTEDDSARVRLKLDELDASRVMPRRVLKPLRDTSFKTSPLALKHVGM